MREQKLDVRGLEGGELAVVVVVLLAARTSPPPRRFALPLSLSLSLAQRCSRGSSSVRV